LRKREKERERERERKFKNFKILKTNAVWIFTSVKEEVSAHHDAQSTQK
jgi:hypothetical protein